MIGRDASTKLASTDELRAALFDAGVAFMAADAAPGPGATGTAVVSSCTKQLIVSPKNYLFQKIQAYNQNHWRNVYASEIGQHSTNWTQGRFCSPKQKLGKLPDELVACINYLECDEPRDDGHSDDDPDI